MAREEPRRLLGTLDRVTRSDRPAPAGAPTGGDTSDADRSAGRRVDEAAPTDPADERALAELRAAGAQLERPRPVHHFVICASHDGACEVSQRLQDAGFEASPFENPTAAGWIVVAERTETVDADSIALGRSLLELIADRSAAHYDGWHTQLLDDERPTFGVRGRTRF